MYFCKGIEFYRQHDVCVGGNALCHQHTSVQDGAAVGAAHEGGTFLYLGAGIRVGEVVGR